MDSQTKSLRNMDSILNKPCDKRIIKEESPVSNISLSDTLKCDPDTKGSTAVLSFLNFQNDFIENVDSQRNSAFPTSNLSSLESQSKILRYLPECLKHNYRQRKTFRKSVKRKKQKQKSNEPKRNLEHKYTTRLATKLPTPVIPSFSVIKTESSDTKAELHVSEEETVSLPDLEEFDLEGFSEFSEDTFVKKKTVKTYLNHKTALPENIPKPVLKALQELLILSNYCEDHIRECVDVLEDYICPDNFSNLIFYILRFLSVVHQNPIKGYMKHQDSSLLQTLMDSHFSQLVIDLDSHPKLQDQGFLLTFLLNMRLLILGMDTMILDGLCAFCRVFTKICFLKNNEKEPIALCCDILKMKHKFATMLVASVAVVWKELFDVSYEAPEEVTTFYGSIALAARKWPDAVASDVAQSGLTTKEWEISKLLVEHNVSALPVYPTENTIKFLIKSIEKKCIKESTEEGSMLMNALFIFASYKTWSWVKMKIVDTYLTPKIKKYSYLAEQADLLTLYCKLYGEICSLNPFPINKPEKLLIKLFTTGCEVPEYEFLRDASAMPLLQLLLSSKKSLPENLEEWIQENESNVKSISIKLLKQRYSLMNKVDFTAEDMLC